MSSTKTEKRAAPRVALDLVLEVYEPTGHRVLGVGRLSNISLAGARMDSTLVLEVGTLLTIHARADEWNFVELPCKVVWTRARGPIRAYGMAFLDLNKQQNEQVAKLMQEYGRGGVVLEKTGKVRLTIGAISGDGVGPEVLREGLKVLQAALDKADGKLEIIHYDFGGERYLKTGEVLPDSALDEFRSLDALYLGAIGHPEVKTGVLEQGLLLKIRFGLDQYINLRPVVLYPGVWTPLKDKGPEHIDFVVVRENTEGAYVGVGGFFKKGTPDEVATQLDINTRKGVERCIRYAFDLCQKRGQKKKLTLVDKANVLTYGHDLWQRIFAKVSQEYPDIQKDHAHVDACCMWFVKNPEWFDVIVTTNMFGDIITDLGAMIQGGMGVAAGGNINPQGVSMFEPIHGSAPKYTGQNVINPIACIAAGSLMLQTLGESEAAQAVDQAIRKALASGKIKSMDAGRMGLSTSEVGDLIASYL